jgi:hypothetical protein
MVDADSTVMLYGLVDSHAAISLEGAGLKNALRGRNWRSIVTIRCLKYWKSPETNPRAFLPSFTCCGEFVAD